MECTVFKVPDMMCEANCGKTVVNAIKSIKGVSTCVLHFPSLTVLVSGESIPYGDIIDTCSAIGFDATPIETTKPDLVLSIDGMMCQKNCATTVQKAIRSRPNVIWAVARFKYNDALVWSSNDSSLIEFTPKVVIDAVEDCGYGATVKSTATISSTSGTTPNTSSSANGNTTTTTPDVTVQLNVEIFNGSKQDSKKNVDQITKLLTAIDGVMSVDVSVAKRTASVWGFCDDDTILKCLEMGHFGGSINGKSNGMYNPMHGNVSSSSSSSSSSSVSVGWKMAEIKIGGMSCAACVRGIESSLLKLKPIKSVRIALLAEAGEITYDSINIDVNEIIATIEGIGYTAKVLTVNNLNNVNKEYMFHVTGMSCANCAIKIEKSIKKMPGVIEANVSCTLNKACIIINGHAPDSSGPREIIEKIKSTGYGCELISNQSNTEIDGFSEIRQWGKLLAVALVLGLPIMFLHMTMDYIPSVMQLFMDDGICHGAISLGQLVMFILSTPLQFGVGYKYYRSAIMGAMHGNFGMDCLVVTGTSITYVYSCVQLFFACRTHMRTMHIFFEASSMLLMFVTLGKFIEAYAKGKTVSAITDLLSLQPKKALLVTSKDVDIASIAETAAFVANNDWQHNEVIEEIEVELLQKGDVLKVLPGTGIPTDGFIVFGDGYIDESMITGESVAVHRKVGDMLFGSTVNQSSPIYIKVSTTGNESALAQIVKLVEKAQMDKAPIQAYADQIAGVFTPIVLLLALVTFTTWYSLSMYGIVPKEWFMEEYGDPLLFSMLFGISVVVVSCPCALGLATPTAIMVGTSVGALNGILIKGGSSFEAAHKITAIIFDKTGTLTEGKPSVTDVLVSVEVGNNTVFKRHGYSDGNATTSGDFDHEVVRLAASAEQGSEHPLANAILHAANKRNLTSYPLVSDSFQMHAGSGISCSIAQGKILIGNRLLMEHNGIIMSSTIDSEMWDLEVQGKTAVIVALNDKVYGILGIADTVKSEAYSSILTLKQMGLDIWMVTGDNRTTAEAIAEELDIPKDRVVAGVLPGDKVSKVEELQAKGHSVAMIGDGINDSPALARADLGIAIGAGTQVAAEAANMILVRSNLSDVVVALDLAKYVFARIRMNFMWALLYNVIAIPYAAGIWFPWTHHLLPPQYAGMSMALSSISVVLSSMALKLYKRPILVAAPSSSSGKGSAATQSSIIQKTTKTLTSIRNSILKPRTATDPMAEYSQLATHSEEDRIGIELGGFTTAISDNTNRLKRYDDDVV